MKTLITQGTIYWEKVGYIPVLVRLTFNDSGDHLNTEWENVLANGDTAWFRAGGESVHVPLTRKAAFDAAKGETV